MQKKAIIYDLDNTIYSVRSIGEQLFAPLFKLITEAGFKGDKMEEIKVEIMRKPFQMVANHFKFGKELTQKGIDLLKSTSYEGEIVPFEDYQEIKKFAANRFLVTTGFLKLQQSKIRQMGIEHDFNEIHIIDPEICQLTKKDVFTDIISRKGYSKNEVLVIGDDVNSEIKAALDLEIDAILYDKFNLYPTTSLIPRITSFKELGEMLVV